MLLAMIAEHFYPGELAFFILALWATWMTGRAVARSWQSEMTFVVYGFFLAGAVRFLHYALYQGPFLSFWHYLSDLVAIIIMGLISYRYTRTRQMVTQYGWLYEKTSPLTWRSK